MIAPISKNGRRPDCLVLVDAENFNSREHLEKLAVEVPKFGRRISMQAYGVGQGQRKLFEQHGFEIKEKIPTVGRHKNLVDMQLVIEAIEIGIKYRSVKTFVIVSSDGDFVPLAKKLTELGKHVISVCGSPQNLNLHSHVHSTVTIERSSKPSPDPSSDPSPLSKANKPSKASTSSKTTIPGAIPDKWMKRIEATLQGLFGSKRKNKVSMAELGGTMSREYSFVPKTYGISWKKLVERNVASLNCTLEIHKGAIWLVKR